MPFRDLLEPLRRAGLTSAEVAALVVLLLGSVALSVVVWWRGHPSPVASPAVPPSTEAVGVAAASPEPAGEVLVHVAGAVRSPGLVRLPGGSRVSDAIAAAGGVTRMADLDGVNLARPVADGEQVVVGEVGASAPAGADPSAATAGGPLPLNSATLEQLDQLPGVGPVMAQRIIAHRDELGGFTDVTQLLEVPGIGPARFADLEALVTVP